ncbi:MbnP family protein [Adhaeribacter soli]|uniref:Copper-binding protein MbnP-like domain-containing protein n=1 Tax=Adhaeribacter soli TaxID=2607655 RepID=A0A5N1IU19_9BACT|nr:MbnP family protein [Adhaeribacter soli]KAA9333594.1 hypothetical protein F0P94_10085 [Adhaeribacter soli]
MKINLKLSHYLAVALPATFLLLGSLSCGKDTPTPKPAPTPPVAQYPDSLAGTMQVNFLHHVDGQPLVFDSQHYLNAADDTFSVEYLKYLISNVKLTNTTTGKTYIEKNSYHLINPKENKAGFDLAGIPVKDFNQIEFSIGVDAYANSRTDHSGDLYPDNGMAWDWNTGYKFMSFGGRKISRVAAKDYGLTFHVGTNQNYKTLTFPLSQTLTFQKNKPYTLQIDANLNELFRSPNVIDFDLVYIVHMGPNAEKVANNYATNMFKIKDISQ